MPDSTEFLSVFMNPDYEPSPDQEYRLANFDEDDVVVLPLDSPADDETVADTPTEQASAPASTEGE